MVSYAGIAEVVAGINRNVWGNGKADSKVYPRKREVSHRYGRDLEWMERMLYLKINLWLYLVRKMKTARRYRFRDTVLLQGYFLLT